MGRYHWPGCANRDRRHAHFGNIMAAVDALRRRVVQAGDPSPIVISSGSVLGPDVLGEFVGETHWLGSIVSLLSRTRYDALALGMFDLSAGQALTRLASLASSSHLPLLAGNLTCSNTKDVRCKSLSDRSQGFVMVRRGLVKVAILSVLPGNLAAYLGKQRAIGLSSHTVNQWVAKTIRRARHRGATIVVLVSDLDDISTAPRKTLALVRALRSDAPDLTIANGMYGLRSQQFIAVINRSDGTAIASSGRFGQSLGHAVITLPQRHGARPSVHVDLIPTTRYHSDQKVARQITAIMSDLCQRIDVPLGHGVIRRPQSRSEFIRYMLRILTRSVHAELAILQDSLFADAGFPLSGRMTRERIERAIRFKDRVVVALVKGSWIKTHLKKYLGRTWPRLWVEGLSKKGKLFYVNGRVIEDAQHYRVATTDFVATGGEGLVPLPKWVQRPTQKQTVRNAAISFFDLDRYRHPKGQPIIDLDRNFVSFHKNFILSLVTSADFSLTGVSILHPGLYQDQPQLNRQRMLGILLDASVTGKAVNDMHEIAATFSVKYGKSKTWITDELTGLTTVAKAETNDLVNLNLLYKFKRWHGRYDPKKWYFPIPYTEGYIQTEITPNLVGDDGRTYRYTETSGSIGPGFMLRPKLFFKIGYMNRSHNILIRGERMLEQGLYAGFTLDRCAITKILKSRIYLESRLDFSFVQIASLQAKELLWTNKLSVSLVDHLSVTINHEFYLYDTKNAPVNIASNLTIGIQVLLDLRHQLY